MRRRLVVSLSIGGLSVLVSGCTPWWASFRLATGEAAPRVLHAERERACPSMVYSPGPWGTRLPASEIHPRTPSLHGVEYGLAGGGVDFPAISRDGGRAWHLDGPCFHVAAAQGALVVSNVGAFSPRRAYYWGLGGSFIRATRDGGRTWWETNVPVVRRVSRHGHTLVAWPWTERPQRWKLTYVSTDGGFTWRAVWKRTPRPVPRLRVSRTVVGPGEVIAVKATGCSPPYAQRDEMTWHNARELAHPHSDRHLGDFDLRRFENTLVTTFRVPLGTPPGRALLDVYCGDASGGNATAYVRVE